MARTSQLTVVVLAASMLVACTGVELVRTPPEALPGTSLTVPESSKGWFRIAFTVAWDWDEEADWHFDALLADQVCAPALAVADGGIGLWRFHRRAARDAVGHRFSLMVYADEQTAERVLERARGSPVLIWLESYGRIESVELTRLMDRGASPIATGSDEDWPPEIQESWPWYIMGVSRTWLSLIDQVKTEEPFEGGPTAALLEYYESVNDRVSALWRVHGQHVYLHHLNAAFGYAPLVVRETNLKRF